MESNIGAALIFAAVAWTSCKGHSCEGHIPEPLPLTGEVRASKYWDEFAVIVPRDSSLDRSPDARWRVVLPWADGFLTDTIDFRIEGIDGDTSRTLLLMHEVDPGSGPSIEWYWSSDSEGLLLHGATREQGMGVRNFCLVYDVSSDAFYPAAELWPVCISWNLDAS
jgi:hypothetical protein